MKIRLCLLLCLTGLMLGLAGCGESSDIQETAASGDSAADESSPGSAASGDSLINPDGGISPYYREPGEDIQDNGNDDTSEASENTVSAEVYNETEDAASLVSDAEADDASVTGRVQRDIFVSVNGSDGGLGTSESPFRTIQKALDCVSPGYTVYVGAGIYSGRNTFTASGTEEEPVTVTAMPMQDAIVTLGYGESGAIFDINGQSNIVIRELWIGYSRSDWVYGIYMRGGEKNITVTDNDICNLATYNRDGSGYGGAYGILMYGKGQDEDSSISDISINNNRVYTIETGHCQAISASGNVENINISSNVVYDIMNNGINLYGNADYVSNPALDQPRNCVISENTVYNCFSDNYAVAGIYLDGARDVEISGNIVYENMYGILVCSEHRDDNYPVTNISISKNTIHDNPDGGISLGGYNTTLSGMVTNSEIRENILFNNAEVANDGWNGEIGLEKCSNIIVADNEITAHNYQYPVISSITSGDFIRNVTFTNNLYLTGSPEKIRFRLAGTTYTGLDSWNKAQSATDVNVRRANK